MICAEHVQSNGGGELTVMRGNEGASRQIAVARTVHLNAAHFDGMIDGVDVLQIMKTGARQLFALPFAFRFTIQP